jgi:hypothetical protein
MLQSSKRRPVLFCFLMLSSFGFKTPGLDRVTEKQTGMVQPPVESGFRCAFSRAKRFEVSRKRRASTSASEW